MERFRYFTPNITFEKGKKEEKDVYLVGGLITDTSRDSDGENVNTQGLDFSEFSFINWNHSKDPGDIIGAPLSWEQTPQGTLMKGELYPEIDKANDVIKLMEALKKSKRGSRLGWSIEGQILERDLIDPSFVKKAKILAVALCPFPKNGKTYAELLEKGFTGEDSYQDDDKLEYDNVNGSEIIIDEEMIQVTKDGDIIDKSQIMESSVSSVKESIEEIEKEDLTERERLQKSFVDLMKSYQDGELSIDELTKKSNFFKEILVNRK